MDLRIYDYENNMVTFSKTPSYVTGVEQLAQYITKLLLQEPESNLYSPDGGEGIFNMEADLFVANKMIIDSITKYVTEQDSEQSQLDDSVKLGDLTDMHIDYKDGYRRINLILYNAEQVANSTTLQESL